MLWSVCSVNVFFFFFKEGRLNELQRRARARECFLNVYRLQLVKLHLIDLQENQHGMKQDIYFTPQLHHSGLHDFLRGSLLSPRDS